MQLKLQRIKIENFLDTNYVITNKGRKVGNCSAIQLVYLVTYWEVSISVMYVLNLNSMVNYWTLAKNDSERIDGLSTYITDAGLHEQSLFKHLTSQ